MDAGHDAIYAVAEAAAAADADGAGHPSPSPELSPSPVDLPPSLFLPSVRANHLSNALQPPGFPHHQCSSNASADPARSRQAPFHQTSMTNGSFGAAGTQGVVVVAVAAAESGADASGAVVADVGPPQDNARSAGHGHGRSSSREAAMRRPPTRTW